MSSPRSACGPVEDFVQTSLGFRCSITTACILKTSPYFDNLKFDILMQVILSATLSRMYCVLGDFLTSTDIFAQNVLLVF